MTEKNNKGKIPLLISACLLGRACRYDGASRPHPLAARLSVDPRFLLLPVCPEYDGGLPTPRIPAERVGARVLNKNGEDVTAAYRRGAARALALAEEHSARIALLKERSPSCGSRMVYDGSFSGKIKKGEGVCSEVLRAAGISVFSEEEEEAFLTTLSHL